MIEGHSIGISLLIRLEFKQKKFYCKKTTTKTEKKHTHIHNPINLIRIKKIVFIDRNMFFHV